MMYIVAVHTLLQAGTAGSGTAGSEPLKFAEGIYYLNNRFWHTCEIRLRATRGFTQISLSAYISVSDPEYL